MKKKVLILGGSYFAGRALVQHLLNLSDMEVTVFNRGNIPLGLSGITQLKGDRTITESIRQNIPPDSSWDIVVDFCGYEPRDIQSVFDAIGGRFGHYIFISSTSVYNHNASLPIRENGVTVSKPQPELGEYAEYGFSKAQAETCLINCCEKNAIPFNILRPAIIYGPFNYAPRENYFFDLIENDQPILIPKQNLSLFSFLFVDDFARIITACFDNERAVNRIVNALAPEFFTYDRYVSVLEQVAGKKLQISEAPVELIIESGIGLPFPIDHHQVYATDILLACIDFKFTPLHLGLEKTYRFYQYLKQKNREVENGRF